MDPIEFPEQTLIIAKDQPEYRPLPAYHYQDDSQGRLVFCWQLNDEERARVATTGILWHTVCTFGGKLQPQLLAVFEPLMPKHVPRPPAEQIAEDTKSPDPKKAGDRSICDMLVDASTTYAAAVSHDQLQTLRKPMRRAIKRALVAAYMSGSNQTSFFLLANDGIPGINPQATLSGAAAASERMGITQGRIRKEGE